MCIEFTGVGLDAESVLLYLLITFPFFPANMWNTRTIRLTSIAMSAHYAGPRNHSNTSPYLVGATPTRLIHSSATAHPSWHPSINIVITAAVNLSSYWHDRPATSSQPLLPGCARHR
jgi:hypothetical protein